MDCIFCKVEIRHEFVYCDTQGRRSSITRYYCQQCKTEYAHDHYGTGEPRALYYRVFHTHNQKKYVAHFNLLEKKFYLGEQLSETALLVHIIFRLNFLPANITPTNFPDKLPTYLIFS